MPRRDGIDVAKYQGFIDWPAVKASGVYWAFYKATLGTTTVDPYFTFNRSGTARAGFRHRGPYHWLTPSSAKPQADHFMNTIGGKLQAGEAIMLDAEQAGINAALADDWCTYVEAGIGRVPLIIVYTGYYVADLWHSTRLFQKGRLRQLAYYGSEARMLAAGGGRAPDGWQWIGQGGRCPGVAGDVDCNQIYTPVSFDGVCATLPPPPPPPPPPHIPGLIFPPAPPQEPTVALELITEPDPTNQTLPKTGAPIWIMRDRFQKWWLRDGRFPPALNAGPLQIMSAEIINAIPNVSAVPPGWTDHRTSTA